MSMTKKLRSLLRHGRLDDELDEEVKFHIEMKTRDYIAAGMSPSDARERALRDFGRLEQTKEECRDARCVQFFEALLQDVRYGLRMLRKSPGFTLVAILTLALGIGVNTAIFSVLDSVLLTNLPVKDPQQLVFLTNPNEQGAEIGFDDSARDFLTYPEFQELVRHNQVFSGLLAASSFTADRAAVEIDGPNSGGSGTSAQVSLVSGSYFSVLGVNPILGRTFGTQVDTQRDANPVAVISYAFWQDRFGGARDVLARKIRIINTSYEVIGVAPPQFHGETVGANPGVWVPLSMQSEVFPGVDYLSPETNHFHKTEWLQVIGRLKAGVTFAQAKAAIDVGFQQLMQLQAAGMSDHDKRQFLSQYLPIAEGSHGASTLREDFGKPLQILMAVVGLILLIACANVANLLLARSASRQKEIAVRVALGAGSSRLFRQVLTESVLLAAIGGLVGLLLARWADNGLVQMVSGGANQISLDVHLDPRILFFTLGVSLLTGVLFGLAPALRVTHVDLNTVLKSASRSVAGFSTRSGRVPVSKALVVAQVALSLLLLVVASLFVRSFQKLTQVQLGYDCDHLAQFHIGALTYGYQRPQVIPLYTEILQRLDAIPGVRGATLADNALLGGTDSQGTITIEGQKPTAGDDDHANWDMVGPNFFSDTGIPILFGRDIGPQDSGNGQRVGVINQTLARKFFPNSNPLGHRVVVHQTNGHFDFVIVGVAADSKHRSVREKPFPRFYVPFFNPSGNDWAGATVIVRTFGDPTVTISEIRAAVKQIAANFPALEIQTMNQRVSASLSSDSMITRLAGAFGTLAIILVCIGLYGVMAYAVSGRVNEIGIRIALGAQRGNILWMVLGESLLLVLIGVAIGLPTVYGAGSWIASLLFGIQPADPIALAAATILMFVVGGFACWIPARRAMRVDAMVALRYE